MLSNIHQLKKYYVPGMDLSAIARHHRSWTNVGRGLGSVTKTKTVVLDCHTTEKSVAVA
jgi:hypothetical protein